MTQRLISHTLLWVVACQLVAGAAHAQTVLHVDDDAPGGGDGQTWETAYNDLQDALVPSARSGGGGVEIRVAQGVYHPAGPGGDRASTFQLGTGVTLKGGYAGLGAPDPNARDPHLYEAILSGDLDGDDGPSFVNNDENSFHILTAIGQDTRSDINGTTVVDGFTITAGNANGAPPTDPYLYLRNHGAGMLNSNASPTVANCRFDLNSASASSGGMYNTEGSSPTIRNCRFLGNRAPGFPDEPFPYAGHAGAIYNNGVDSNPTLTDCTFENNWAWGSGGAVFNLGNSPTFTRCTFISHEADIDGGAIHNKGLFANSVLTQCIFVGNSAVHGGAMDNAGSEPTLISCLFIGNTASLDGGAIYDWLARPTLTNCTFSANSASGNGGALFLARGSTPTLANCILWGNTDSGEVDESAQIDIHPEIPSTPAVNYCSVLGWTGSLGGVGNIGADPLFLDADGPDDVPGTQDDNLRLASASPCIDAADPNFDPQPGETDLDGHARVLCNRLDMGSYEFGIGDFNCDRLVSLDDFASWDPCMTGPEGSPYNPGCEHFDFEFDADVDLPDFAGFQAVLTYP